ncbi:MAG: hypothetical protein SH819_04785 [Cytophagales bacterium]|nr:hypothetical protein [Cytophagales bacterium]
MAEKKCLECGTILLGRIDKKFCSDQCRSTHYNRNHAAASRYMRRVNNVLSRNRRILDSLNPGGKIKVSASRLKEEGFDFRYHTGVCRTRDGGTYYYCYEQGYVPIAKNYFLLVIRNDVVR